MVDAFQEAALIINKAKKNGVSLRLIGGLAAFIFCDDLDFCEREHGDIDFVGLSQESPLIIKTLVEIGYRENTAHTLALGGTQLLFEKPGSKEHVDVFLDILHMEHDIDLRKRLNIEALSISASDLLVCKLIIHHLNEKDFRDIITIVKALNVGEEDISSVINRTYIGEICSKSWGLYHDLVHAIDECLNFLHNYHFKEDVTEEIVRKFQLIRKTIVEYPKSTQWKLRSYIGERYPWRKQVELECLEH